MKLLRTAIVVSIVASTATTAWAQFGLYGSPDILNLPQAPPAIVPCNGSAPLSARPVGPAAGTWQPAPTAAGYGAPRYSRPRPSMQTALANQNAALPAQPAPPRPPSLPGDPAETNGSQPGPNLVDQMLSDPDSYAPPASLDDPAYGGGGASGDQSGSLMGAVNSFEEAACGEYGWTSGGGGSPWYASVSALIMGRDEPNRLYTTYETGNDPRQYEPGQLRWRWGGEIRVGRRFCCGCRGTRALEATYWGLEGFHGLWVYSHPNTVSTPLTVSGIEFPNPSPPPAYINGTAYFDNATEHRVWRHDEVHNVELNVVRAQVFTASEYPWDVDWLLGVRYFRFDESFTFGSVASPYVWGQYGGIYEAYIHDRITNNLAGFQFGFDADYYVLENCRFFLTPKFAICNNQIDHYFHIYRGDGAAARPVPASGISGSYPVRSSEDCVSFLMQLDIGLQWDFTPNWSARVGYRVVAATGIGLADNQIPHYVVDIPAIADIDTNGELVLHGAFLGLTYNF